MPSFLTSLAIVAKKSRLQGPCGWCARAGCPDHYLKVFGYQQHAHLFFRRDAAMPPLPPSSYSPRLFALPKLSRDPHCCTATDTFCHRGSTSRSNTKSSVSEDDIAACGTHAGVVAAHRTTQNS